jgi:hypothetical protein
VSWLTGVVNPDVIDDVVVGVMAVTGVATPCNANSKDCTSAAAVGEVVVVGVVAVVVPVVVVVPPVVVVVAAGVASVDVVVVVVPARVVETESESERLVAADVSATDTLRKS